MAATRESRTITRRIEVPLNRAWALLRDPASFALWATGLGGGLRREGETWVARTPEGEARIRFTPDNPFGVLDHSVTLPSGEVVHVPMRVIANGEGCEVMLTLFRQPGMDDARYAADAAWIEADLTRLKTLLETGTPSR